MLAVRLCALALLIVALPACSWFGSKEDIVPDDPADKLYNEGLYLLNNKRDYKQAAKKFEEVDRQHPYSEWARKSLLMSAYAQYLIGSSYYDQIPDISRDQQRTQKAMEALDEVSRKYPNTEYAVAAKKKLEMARDQLAGKEMDTARFYQKRRDYIAAINRFKVVITQYQTTRHVEEALMRLTEAYMSLGIVNEAQTAAAVLGHNFPDSPWYKDAYRLVKSGGLEPSEDRGSWISKAFKKVGLGWAN